MPYVPPQSYELPSPGQHVGVFVDEIDHGFEPNRYDASKPPRHMTTLIFLVDELGTDGKPLQVRKKLNLTRHKDGDLIKYMRAFCYPNPLPTNWNTPDYFGVNVGLNIVHGEPKPSGQYADIESVFPLPATAKRLSIPAGYVRQGGQAATAFPGNQPKPPQSTAQAARATRAKGEPFETGLQESAQVLLE